MPHLKNATTGAETLGASAVSQVFSCMGEIMDVYITGTASTSTLTLKASPNQLGPFNTYVVDNSSGTPTNQAFTSTQVAASSLYHVSYKEHGMYFRFETDPSGTPAWGIEVNGDHVTIHE